MDTFELDGSPFALQPTDTDFPKLWREARSRWLRPSEIYDILINHSKFAISKEPLNLPPSGSLVLFDRKMLRNFRRDGHPWRKKKDNKTVKEAHEHLKVGGMEKIHVYYAHGDGESHLQRRVYWLLDKSLEHIVLVHYLEVKEGAGVSTLLIQPTSVQSIPHESYTAHKPSYFTGGKPVNSSGSSAGAVLNPPWDFSEFNSNANDEFDKFCLDDLGSTGETGFGNTTLESPWINETTGLARQQINDEGNGIPNGSSMIWSSLLPEKAIDAPSLPGHQEEQSVDSLPFPIPSSSFPDSVPKRTPIDLQSPFGSQGVRSKSLERSLCSPPHSKHTNESGKKTHRGRQQYLLQFTSQDLLHWLQLYCLVYAPDVSCLSKSLDGHIETEDSSFAKREKNMPEGACSADLSLQIRWLENGDEVMKKLDSLERWLQTELPTEGKTSPLTQSTISCSVLDTIMHDSGKNTEDGLNLGWQPSVTQEMTPCVPQPFFEITDYSPAWSFLTESAKVIVTGHFNGDMADFQKVQWLCMFGDKEVQAEVVQLGVIRFMTPKDAALGKVFFYLTDESKHTCSDVKDFDLRERPELHKPTATAMPDQEIEDMRLQHRLAHVLLQNDDHSIRNAWSNQNTQSSTSSVSSVWQHLTAALDQEWTGLDDLLNKRPNDLSEVKDLLMQLVFKCVMMNLAGSKAATGGGASWRSFDHSGQAAIHIASALGYEWVINLLKASGMSIDFRDKGGWTALHWAAFYGREKMVAALLAAGAKPGAISDPVTGHSSGLTPADVAASAGYEGLAGYLSEQDLASHLSALTLAENERDKRSADDEGHRVVEYLKRSMSLRRSVKTREDELALEDSLSAIGNSTIISARIHAAFKEYFMRERLHAIEEVDEYGFSAEEQLAVQKIQKAYRNHRDRKRKWSAALKIQNRFRGYQTRRNFLSLRQNAIRIQAYYRMHRARKHYQRILWAAGVLEKAMLRWRQRRKGLRGYQPEAALAMEAEDGNDFLLIGRKQAEDALDRAVVLVQSMVRSRLARQQYRRMKGNHEQAKVKQMENPASEQENTG